MPRVSRFRFRLEPGARLVLLYVFFVYVLRAGILALTESPPNLYVDLPPFGLPLVFLVLAFGIYLVFGNFRRGTETPASARYRFRFIGLGTQSILLTIVIAVGVIGQRRGFADFRYREASLSEGLSGTMLTYVAAPAILSFLLLVVVFFEPARTRRARPFELLRNSLLFAGLFLVANGTRTYLVAALGAACLLFPRTVRRLVATPTEAHDSSLASRVRHSIAVLVIASLVVTAAPAAWMLGETVKRGESQSVIENVRDRADVGTIFSAFFWLSSPSYVSLRVALDRYAFATDPAVLRDNLMAPIRSFVFRVQSLGAGRAVGVRPEDGSIMRVNYNLVSANPTNVREGTAPGLIAGFLYCFPFPLNFAVLVAYLLFLQRFLDRLIAGTEGTLTFVGQLLLLVFVAPMFESPIDFLLIVDDGVIALILLVILRQFALVRTDTVPRPRGELLLAPAG